MLARLVPSVPAPLTGAHHERMSSHAHVGRTAQELSLIEGWVPGCGVYAEGLRCLS
jgi:hypothetical protein